VLWVQMSQAIYRQPRPPQHAQTGLEPRLSMLGRAGLATAQRRIRELEAVSAVHRRATKLLKETSHPRLGSRLSGRWRAKG
jgi:hypothetical protein